MNALKRKKRLEKQLQQIDGTLSTIEFQREALENAQTNIKVLNNMSFAAKALKAVLEHLCPARNVVFHLVQPRTIIWTIIMLLLWHRKGT